MTHDDLFEQEWTQWPDRRRLVQQCHGDNDLALLLYRVAGPQVWSYLDSRPPFLDGASPGQCLQTREGRRRLHSGLLKFPYL